VKFSSISEMLPVPVAFGLLIPATAALLQSKVVPGVALVGV